MEHYTLYNNDVPVAEFSVNKASVLSFLPYRPELLPMQIRSASVEGFVLWLQERSIDLNTFQHRELARQFFGSRDKLSLALLTHMFSISDTFTCFEDNEPFEYRRALCSPKAQDDIADFILLAGDTTIRRMNYITPNASTDGSFAKTWKYEGGEWWLYKLQSTDASRSECEISKVLLACGWDAAEYRYVGSYRKRLRSRNFVGKNEFFEPYDSFRFIFEDRSDNDEVILQNLSSLGVSFRKAWLRILLADALFMNTDRHMRNFGVIRSAKTGKVLRLAPNFDNNQAFKANPGSHYSDSMLKLLMDSYGSILRDDLGTLVAETSKHPYLIDAVAVGEKYC